MKLSDLHAGYDQNAGDKSEHTDKSPTQRPITAPRGHCHDGNKLIAMDKSARRKLLTASALCLIFMVGETIGGALAQSLAIMTDAAHLLTDFASFLISLLALFLATRPSTKKMSFGWHRAEVVGALASVLLIWLVTGILVYLAVVRIMHGDYEVEGKIMLITSAIGVGVNLIMVFTLHDHGHSHSDANETSPLTAHSHNNSDKSIRSVDVEKVDSTRHSHEIGPFVSEKLHKQKTEQNITVRAAFIHVIGDLIQSVGVMVAAMIIFFRPDLKIVDPICTFLFSILVLFTTVNVLRDTLNVLMEATPKSLVFNDVKNALANIPGVLETHNLRMWSLTTNKTAVIAHLAIASHADSQDILRTANRLLREQYLVHDVTIQLEPYVAEMANCQLCQEPVR